MFFMIIVIIVVVINSKHLISFKWIYGSNETDEECDKSKSPGSRIPMFLHQINSSNLILVSGYGSKCLNSSFNDDIWIYNVDTNLFQCLVIRNETNAYYGIKNVFDEDNSPGSRVNVAESIDFDDNIVVLSSGLGYFDDVMEVYNDIWIFDLVSFQFKWVYGYNESWAMGSYGSYYGFDFIPHARMLQEMVRYNSDVYLLFFGWRPNSGLLNDVWMYNRTLNSMKWVSGSNGFNDQGVMISKNNFNESNHPSARAKFIIVKISEERVLIFGGISVSETLLNDVWIYDIVNEQFAWVNGGNNSAETNGVIDTYSQDNIPPPMHSPITFLNDINLGSIEYLDFIYIMQGVINTNTGEFNNLIWVYNITLNQFKWVKNETEEYYGEKGGDYNTLVVPAKRTNGVGLLLSNSYLFLYGGTDRSDVFMGEIDCSNCGWFICYDKLSVEDDVCTSKGDCLDKDTCDCDVGFFGDKCASFYCFGTSNGDEDVCSSVGECEDYDTCDCDDDYYGLNCQFHYCFTILSNSSSVCSSRGECTGPDECTCTSPAYGIDCFCESQAACSTNFFDIIKDDDSSDDSSSEEEVSGTVVDISENITINGADFLFDTETNKTRLKFSGTEKRELLTKWLDKGELDFSFNIQFGEIEESNSVSNVVVSIIEKMSIDDYLERLSEEEEESEDSETRRSDDTMIEVNRILKTISYDEYGDDDSNVKISYESDYDHRLNITQPLTSNDTIPFYLDSMQLVDVSEDTPKKFNIWTYIENLTEAIAGYFALGMWVFLLVAAYLCFCCLPILCKFKRRFLNKKYSRISPDDDY